MSKAVSNRLIWFWEKGYLYIAIACLIHFVWFLSDNVGMLDWIKEIAYFEYFKTEEMKLGSRFSVVVNNMIGADAVFVSWSIT